MRHHFTIKLLVIVLTVTFSVARAGQYYFAHADDHRVAAASSKITKIKPASGRDLLVRHMEKGLEERIGSQHITLLPFAGILVLLGISFLLSAFLQFCLPALPGISAALLPNRRLALIGIFRL